MIWQDRVPTYANRYKITRSDGTTEYVTLERADEPSVEGTPLNAANLNALESAVASKMNADDGVKMPEFITSTTTSFNDFYVQGKTTIYACVYDLDDAPNSSDSFTVITTSHGSDLTGQQIAYTVGDPVKMYARRYMNGEWGNWVQYVAAEYDSATNTLNFIM